MRKTSVKGTCPECREELVLTDVALNACGGYEEKGIKTLWSCQCGFQISSHKSLAEWLDILEVKLPEKFVHKDKIVWTFKVEKTKVNEAIKEHVFVRSR